MLKTVKAMKNGFILKSSFLAVFWLVLWLMCINTKFKPRKNSQLYAFDQRLLLSNMNSNLNESFSSFIDCTKEAEIITVIKSKPNNFVKRKFIR